MATLAEVTRALATGQLTARAYTDNLLSRIRARDDRVRAWACIDPVQARQVADACDLKRRARGASGTSGALEKLGPLHGMPVGVKDIIDTRGMATEYGSPIFAGHRPAADADIVRRLREVGAFVLGKTISTEFAYMQPAETRNPWNTAHTPGGSSSGAAAAIAAGFVHAAIGTQTNGSVIRPAAYCGVVGFKPTFGLLPSGGVRLFSASFDTVGTFARTVPDCILFTSHLVEANAFPPQIDRAGERPTLGVIMQFPWNTLEAEARVHFDASLASLAAAGAKIVPITLPSSFVSAHQIHRTIMLHEAARLHRDTQDTFRSRFSNVLNAALDEGRTISGSTYGEMLARRAALINEARGLFDAVAAIISPPAPGPAPRIETTGDPSFCTLWSLVGFPAISVPSGLAANGLPLGVQLACRAGQDGALLGIAQWVETTLGTIALRE